MPRAPAETTKMTFKMFRCCYARAPAETSEMSFKVVNMWLEPGIAGFYSYTELAVKLFSYAVRVVRAGPQWCFPCANHAGRKSRTLRPKRSAAVRELTPPLP